MFNVEKIPLVINGGVDYSAPASLIQKSKSPYCINWIYKDNKLVRRGGVSASVFGSADTGSASVRRIYEYIDGNGNGHSIAATNTGVYEWRKASSGTWTEQTSGTIETLNDVSVLSDSSIFVCGSNGTILQYNGTSWLSMTSGTAENLNGIFALDATHVYCCGANGTILFYNGTAWSTIVSGTSEDLYAIWASSSSNVFVVGDSKTLVRYNGTSWTASTPFLASGNFRHIDGSSSTNIYVGSTNGLVYKFNGTAWSTHITTGIGSGIAVRGIMVFSTTSIIIAGASKVVAWYNGTSWSSTVVPNTTTTPWIVWGEARNSLYYADTTASGNIYYYDGVNGWVLIGPMSDYSGSIKGKAGSKIVSVTNNGGIFMKTSFGTADSWTSIGTWTGSDSKFMDGCIYRGYLYLTNGVANLQVWKGYGGMEDVVNAENDATHSPPDAPEFVESFADHLFLGKAEYDNILYPQRVIWSSVGNPTKWLGGSSGYEDLSDDPYPITGMVSAGGVLLVFKPYKIYVGKYSGSGFSFIPTSSQIGTKSPGSIAKMGNGIIFAGNDNIYYMDSTTLKAVGTPIFKKLMDEIDQDEVGSIIGTVLEDDNQYWLLYKPTDATSYTAGFVWNFKEDKWSEITFDLPGSIGISTIASIGSPVSLDRWVEDYGAWEDDTATWDSGAEYAKTRIIAVGCDNGIVYSIDDDTPVDITSPFESTVKTPALRMPVVSLMSSLAVYGSGGTLQCRVGVGRSEKDTQLFYPPKFDKKHLDGKSVYDIRTTGDWFQAELMTNGESDNIELISLDMDMSARTASKRTRR